MCILDNVGQESSVNDLLYNWLEKERRKDKKKNPNDPLPLSKWYHDFDLSFRDLLE